jgi:acetyltransferase-like isoleucine patch superfamily enzyme
MIISNNKPFVAISYDTTTFKDLQYWFKTLHQLELGRIEPNYDLSNLPNTNQYINLIVQDLELKERITNKLSADNFDRFSFVHPDSSVNIDIGPTGCFIYPGTVIYPHAKIGQDVLIHANSLIAHFCDIGTGTFISGGVTIGGSTHIGSYCWIGIGATILDQLQLASNVKIVAGAIIRKNISEKGRYYTIFKTNKLKDTKNKTL